jgi:hypothetical protein
MIASRIWSGQLKADGVAHTLLAAEVHDLVRGAGTRAARGARRSRAKGLRRLRPARSPKLSSARSCGSCRRARRVLRHTCITKLVRKGSDVVLVAELAGTAVSKRRAAIACRPTPIASWRWTAWRSRTDGAHHPQRRGTAGLGALPAGPPTRTSSACTSRSPTARSTTCAACRHRRAGWRCDRRRRDPLAGICPRGARAGSRRQRAAARGPARHRRRGPRDLRAARAHASDRQRAAQLAHFRDPDARDVDDVEDLLVEHALEHDTPLALLRTAAITLRDRQLLRPAISTLERLVASARARAERDTYERLEPVLDAQTRRALHALCVTDVRLGVSRLVWLGRERDLPARRRSWGSWRSSRSCASSVHPTGTSRPCPPTRGASSPPPGARRPRRSPAVPISCATPWSAAPSMSSLRSGHTTTLLARILQQGERPDRSRGAETSG